MTKPPAAFFLEQLAGSGINLMPISIEHAAKVATLPFHHRDPFDRLLITQSLTEGFPVVSADAAFDAYGVARLWD